MAAETQAARHSYAPFASSPSSSVRTLRATDFITKQATVMTFHGPKRKTVGFPQLGKTSHDEHLLSHSNDNIETVALKAYRQLLIERRVARNADEIRTVRDVLARYSAPKHKEHTDLPSLLDNLKSVSQMAHSNTYSQRLLSDLRYVTMVSAADYMSKTLHMNLDALKQWLTNGSNKTEVYNRFKNLKGDERKAFEAYYNLHRKFAHASKQGVHPSAYASSAAQKTSPTQYPATSANSSPQEHANAQHTLELRVPSTTLRHVSKPIASNDTLGQVIDIANPPTSVSRPYEPSLRSVPQHKSSYR